MERTKTRKFIAEKIRSEYVKDPAPKHSLDALARLQELDRKVKKTPMVFSLILGIVSAIFFGIGMVLAMRILPSGEFFGLVYISEDFIDWLMIPGIIIGVGAIILMIINYPIYRAWSKKRHRLYADEVISLSDSVLGEVDFVTDMSAESSPYSADMFIIPKKEEKVKEEKTNESNEPVENAPES